MRAPTTPTTTSATSSTFAPWQDPHPTPPLPDALYGMALAGLLLLVLDRLVWRRARPTPTTPEPLA